MWDSRSCAKLADAALGSYIHEQTKLFTAKGAAAVPEEPAIFAISSCRGYSLARVLGYRKAPKGKRAFNSLRLCLQCSRTSLSYVIVRASGG